MEKNFTLFSNVSFTSNEKKLVVKETDLKGKAIPEDQCPSPAVIANILNFSKALEVFPMKSIEEQPGIEVVLN